jgi:predicted ATP-grasp superfamily ATP-dependent carboligase
MSVNSSESKSTKAIALGNRSCRSDRRFKPWKHDPASIPAVVVGAPAAGSLGVVRTLSQADIPVILLEENSLAPAMHTRYCRKIAISRASGVPLVAELLALAAAFTGPAVLFLTSDDAALTVSEYRTELESHYRFRLPSHDCLTALIHKTSFQRLAEAHGFPVPRAVIIERTADLSRLAELRFPCIVKPPRATLDYVRSRLARAYKVASREQTDAVCRRMLAVVPNLLVQEWIEGPESGLYFCLQYRAADGATVCSFTGRKLSIWPPDVGVTASCTTAPEVRPILQPLTEAFFKRVSFVGMGGIEFKKDVRTGRFLMIEPTVGRVDAQEEVATIHGVNIPLAAYLYEIGAEVPLAEQDLSPVIWRDFFSHWRSVYKNRSQQAIKPNTRVYDAYWRLDDPMPAFFHVLGGSMRFMRKAAGRALKRP